MKKYQVKDCINCLVKKHREYVGDAGKDGEHMKERFLEEDEPYEIPKREHFNQLIF